MRKQEKNVVSFPAAHRMDDKRLEVEVKEMAEVWRDGEMWRLIEHCGAELVWRLSRIRNTRQDCFTHLHTFTPPLSSPAALPVIRQWT